MQAVFSGNVYVHAWVLSGTSYKSNRWANTYGRVYNQLFFNGKTCVLLSGVLEWGWGIGANAPLCSKSLTTNQINHNIFTTWSSCPSSLLRAGLLIRKLNNWPDRLDHCLYGGQGSSNHYMFIYSLPCQIQLVVVKYKSIPSNNMTWRKFHKYAMCDLTIGRPHGECACIYEVCDIRQIRFRAGVWTMRQGQAETERLDLVLLTQNSQLFWW
jgi:hypothetical protein